MVGIVLINGDEGQKQNIHKTDQNLCPYKAHILLWVLLSFWLGANNVQNAHKCLMQSLEATHHSINVNYHRSTNGYTVCTGGTEI